MVAELQFLCVKGGERLEVEHERGHSGGEGCFQPAC